MHLTKSRKGFSIFSLLTPAFFYLIAAIALIGIVFNIYQILRPSLPIQEEEPVVDETPSDEDALTNAEDEILPKQEQTPETESEPEPTPTPKPKPKPKPEPEPGPQPASTVTRKVLVLDFDPYINGQRTHSYFGWNDPATLETQFAADIKSSSGNYVKYQIQRIKLDDFPVLNGGFDFDEESFLDCWNDPDHPESKCHTSVGVDYNRLLTDYGVDVCALRNGGQIHELWVWGAPYFGYYESRLAGPGAFWYNSPPLTGTSCTKQLPIMGFNYERGVGGESHLPQLGPVWLGRFPVPRLQLQRLRVRPLRPKLYLRL